MSAPAVRRADAEPAVAFAPVLYACDFSAGAPDALRVAVALARTYGAGIVGLHVIPTRLPAKGGFRSLPNPSLLRPSLRADLGRALDGALQPARAAGATTRSEIREGIAADEILQAAEALDAGVVVVGTRRRGVVGRSALGSVAENVLRHSGRPVLAVPADFHACAAWPQKILWATDFSADAALALRYAASIATRCDAELVALHVDEARVGQHRDSMRDVEERLRGEVAVAGAARRVATVAAAGRAADVIAAEAAAQVVDLVVMGASGAGALGRWVGSTVTAVARHSECPVLVVPRR